MPIFVFLAFFLFSSYQVFSSELCQENRDTLGISHIKVSKQDDYYFCFGFIHARDRGWQMDFFRRITQGRNAEVLGFTHLKSDLMMRLLNLPALADSLWLNLSEKDKQWWLFYTQGVNAGMKLGVKNKEFLLADYTPEVWKPEHSIAILLLQSFDQTRKSFLKDHEELLATEKYGNKAIELFSLDHLPWDDTILHAGEYPQKIKTTSTSQTSFSTMHSTFWEQIPSLFGDEAGSNNWVINKFLSKNKNALLANDPHLNLKTPSYWYWLNIKIQSNQKPEENVNVIGGSLPGLPFIVNGTNEHISWGITNAYINTADIALIKDVPEEEIESILPLVWFKFGFLKLPFFFKSFERTKKGFPILPLENNSKQRLFLRWSGFWLKPTDLIPLFNLKSV